MDEMQKRETLRLPLAPSLLLSLALVFFMAFCAFPEVTLARYMVILVFALLLLIAVRSRLVTVLSLIPCALAFLSAEHSPSLVLLLCAVAVIGYGGFAIASIHPLLVLATPVASCLLALWITGDLACMLSTLIFVPPALVAALALRLKLSRTASIVAVAAAFTGILLISFCFWLAPLGESVSDLVLSLRTWMTSELTAAWNTAAASGLLAEAVTEQDILPLVNISLRHLPATLIVVVELLAYLACLIAITLRGTQFPEEKLPLECRVFRMSAPSAVLFLASFALTLLPMGRSDAVGILLVSASNLFVILLPGLALCGVIRILVSFRQKRAFPPLILILLCFWFFSILPTILALTGAFTILRTEKLLHKNRENKG